MQEQRTSRRERLAGLPECIVLVAPAADRAEGTAIGPHQHLRARPLRRGALRADDRHERDGVATRERLGRCGEEFLVQTSTSIFAFCFSD